MIELIPFEHDRHPVVVGRIWRCDYRSDSSGPIAKNLWHWRYVDGRPDTTGHAPTLESAMADFRRAWDANGVKTA